jgi:hypothetical protein
MIEELNKILVQIVQNINQKINPLEQFVSINSMFFMGSWDPENILVSQ